MHSYDGPNMPAVEENRAVVLGEYGGLGKLPIKGHTWKSEDNWGYVSYANANELAAAYSELTTNLFELKDKGLSAAVYTQTTDVEVEVNGLMTYDRKINKIDPEVLARINQGYFPPKIVAESNLFLNSIEVKIINIIQSGDIRYTTDGTEPTVNSELYVSPLIIKENTTLNAVTFWNDAYPRSVASKTFKKTTIVEGINVENPQKDIEYKYFENNSDSYSAIPDYGSIVPIEEGKVDQINIEKNKREKDFGFSFNGYLKIEKEGVYTFFLASDDGSILKIGDGFIIDHDGIHGMTTKQSTIALAKGFHKITADFFQGMSGAGLEVSYKGPGISKTLLSADMLYH